MGDYTLTEKLEILKGYMHTEAMEHEALKGATVESIAFAAGGNVTHEIILRTEIQGAEYGTSFDPLIDEPVERHKTPIENSVRDFVGLVEEDLNR